MSAAQESETLGFQTEARQLLKLMIHSLYSNREIFLRELVSNASDAIDKLRFKAIANPDLAGSDTDYAIEVTFDADAGTVTVADNGIGMTRDEVIANLGTIARSGTAEFLESLTGSERKDAALIGQFGVGFYSAFIVADEVEVVTRSAGGGDGTRWVSKGEDTFSVEGALATRGTRVTLHLRADAREFADGYRLRSIVRKYSDHIGVPVRMHRETSDDGEGEGGLPEFETVNDATALWTRSRSDISDDEYLQFYRHVSHDFGEPLTWSHNRVEGKLEYTSLLYVPKKAPFDLWNRDAPRGLKLYVQRVFIMDDAEQFLPLYLRFVRGVIDSNDLPLNVSREILQQDERVTSIRNALTKRVLTTLDGLATKEPDKYQEFWGEFGEVLKEGAGEDWSNREAIAGLLRFTSTTAADSTQSVGLAASRERMVEGQDKIYYLVAESLDTARSSPHLEVFRKRGLEVLLLTDRIDEWLMGNLTEFDGTAFEDVSRAELELPGDDSTAGAEPHAVDDEALAARIRTALGDLVDEVRASKRLTDSPACLVLPRHALGAQMRRIMEATGQNIPETKPHFEYNAEHPLLVRLAHEADEDRFAEVARLLFDQATLAEGGTLRDPAAYVNRLNRLLVELL
jgi:molecular chaperone HtpG